MNQPTQDQSRAEDEAARKKLPASNYGFPNHDDGIQSGNLTGAEPDEHGHSTDGPKAPEESTNRSDQVGP